MLAQERVGGRIDFERNCIPPEVQFFRLFMAREGV